MTCPNKDTPTMKWYLFLVWFVFTVVPVVSVIGGLQAFDGMRILFNGLFAYEAEVFLAPDIACGISAIGLACFGIYVRFRLTGYKKAAPKLVTGYFAATAVITAILVFWYVNILETYYSLASVDIVPYLWEVLAAVVAVSALMIVINIVYFKKREHLFVN